MEIYVVRHGQTEYNVKNIFQGHADIPLNNIGLQQAEETAQKFKNMKPDVILASPLQRTIQTAECIGKITGTPITIEPCLIERDFGDMEGKKGRPDWNIQMMLDYARNYDKEHIEPIQELFKRVYRFLDKITEECKEKQVVLVTHGAVSQPIECYFNGEPEILDFEHLEKLTLKNCEVRKYTQRAIKRRIEEEQR